VCTPACPAWPAPARPALGGPGPLGPARPSPAASERRRAGGQGLREASRSCRRIREARRARGQLQARALGSLGSRGQRLFDARLASMGRDCSVSGFTKAGTVLWAAAGTGPRVPWVPWAGTFRCAAGFDRQGMFCEQLCEGRDSSVSGFSRAGTDL